MELILSFIAIAEAAAIQENKQKEAVTNPDAQPTFHSLAIVQPEGTKVELRFLEPKTKSVFSG